MEDNKNIKYCASWRIEMLDDLFINWEDNRITDNELAKILCCLLKYEHNGYEENSLKNDVIFKSLSKFENQKLESMRIASRKSYNNHPNNRKKPTENSTTTTTTTTTTPVEPEEIVFDTHEFNKEKGILLTGKGHEMCEAKGIKAEELKMYVSLNYNFFENENLELEEIINQFISWEGK